MSYPIEKKITLFLIHIRLTEKILNIEVIAFLSKLTGLQAQYVLRYLTEKIKMGCKIKQFRICCCANFSAYVIQDSIKALNI